MALAADKETKLKGVPLREFSLPVKAATTIYKGALVSRNASGYAIGSSDTASEIVVGVAVKQANNSAGAAGAIRVIVRQGVFLLAATSIAITAVGAQMYVVDDQTVDETDPGNTCKSGVLVEYVSATSGWVLLDFALGC